jgi:hypothetical protein
MNYYGKIPLRMRCPHCNDYDSHPVIKSDSRVYHWDKETVSLFERIAGRDISYRRHSKRCKSCGRSFISIELASVFLEKLIKEVQQLDGSLRVTKSTLKQTIAQRDALVIEQKETHRVIRAASKNLNRRLPQRKTRS